MGNSGYKLFVQIGNKFEPIDGLITGENLKPIIKTKLRDAIDKYINTCTVRKCKKNFLIENIKHAIFDKQTNIAKSSFMRFGYR